MIKYVALISIYEGNENHESVHNESTLVYKADEVDARIRELKEENKRISKLYEAAQGGWKKALLEIEALKKGRTP